MQMEDPEGDSELSFPLLEVFHEHPFCFSCTIAKSMRGSIHKLPNFLNVDSSIGDYSH
jgi:hypothetical protein